MHTHTKRADLCDVGNILAFMASYVVIKLHSIGMLLIVLLLQKEHFWEQPQNLKEMKHLLGV